MTGESRLGGDDVVLLFDASTTFNFQDQATVNLNGRQTGPYAGMVIATQRDNKGVFRISSDRVENLLGVIYIPEAQLLVEGGADVARTSAWTVIVAKRLSLTGSPSIYINANYAGSPVPVPDGVGPRPGGTQLVD